jgi:hypothetical protein
MEQARNLRWASCGRLGRRTPPEAADRPTNRPTACCGRLSCVRFCRRPSAKGVNRRQVALDGRGTLSLIIVRGLAHTFAQRSAHTLVRIAAGWPAAPLLAGRDQSAGACRRWLRRELATQTARIRSVDSGPVRSFLNLVCSWPHFVAHDQLGGGVARPLGQPNATTTKRPSNRDSDGAEGGRALAHKAAAAALITPLISGAGR